MPLTPNRIIHKPPPPFAKPKYIHHSPHLFTRLSCRLDIQDSICTLTVCYASGVSQHTPTRMAEPAPAPIPTLRERMAALNMAHVGSTSTDSPPSYNAAVKKAKPPPLPTTVPKRPAAHRADSVNNPPTVSHGIASSHAIANQPARGGLKELLPPPTLNRTSDAAENKPSLPVRRPTGDMPQKVGQKSAPPPIPALPPRRPSAPSRKQSTESIASVVSNRSAMSNVSTPRTSMSSTNGTGFNGAKPRMRAPEYDPATLPTLPQRKTSTPEETQTGRPSIPGRPNRTSIVPAQEEAAPSLPSRPIPPPRPNTTVPDRPRRSALEFGMNKSTEMPPPMPTRPGSTASVPPPIPTGSRPDLKALQASKPKLGANGTHAAAATIACCLKCRDFSGPDNHAARFPRQSIPSTDIGWLARELTAPFTSETDKARSIFKWLHHNINYDTAGFFSGNIKPSTPASTIASGLAVCEGYAGLFAALAMAAGLEAVVITGHGKGTSCYPPLSPNPTNNLTGYGYNPAAPPLKPDGHAWNAVRIDNGAWKLIDPCWGAGHVECEKKDPNKPWVVQFHPEQFTKSNDEFGESHYPEDRRYFFRDDGRPQIGFDEYLNMDRGPEPVQVYNCAWDEHGIEKKSVYPKDKAIKVNDPLAPGPTIRFQAHKICPHWDFERHGTGKPYLLVVKVNGRDGNSPDYYPVEFDGYNWWIDIPRDMLGRPGQDVWLYTQRTYMNGIDGRGLTAAEYRRTRKQWTSWGWAGVAQWTLA